MKRLRSKGASLTVLQLVYTSVATELPTAEAIDALCEQARRNNRAAEITGALAVRGNRYLQALEGPKEAVEDTFLRIMVDPRHYGVTLLSRSITTRRQFSEWEMAAYREPAYQDEMVRYAQQLTESATPDVQKAFAEFMRSGL